MNEVDRMNAAIRRIEPDAPIFDCEDEALNYLKWAMAVDPAALRALAEGGGVVDVVSRYEMEVETMQCKESADRAVEFLMESLGDDFGEFLTIADIRVVCRSLEAPGLAALDVRVANEAVGFLKQKMGDDFAEFFEMIDCFYHFEAKLQDECAKEWRRLEEAKWRSGEEAGTRSRWKERWLDDVKPPYGALIMELDYNICMDARRYALALSRATAEGREMTLEDIDTRGTVISSCGDIRCMNVQHLHIERDAGDDVSS